MKVSGPFTSGAGSTAFGQGAPATGDLLRHQQEGMAAVIFGQRPPRLLDKRRYASLKKALRKLGLIKDQVAEAMGLSGEAFRLELCEEENASIDPNGQIAVGVDLLEQYENDSDFLAGVLAHEAGHRPWEWPNLSLAGKKLAEIQELHRNEEDKADRNAGRILADMGLSPDSICEFLLRNQRFEGVNSALYYPPQTRTETIRAEFEERSRILDQNGKHFPHLTLRSRELR